jgi:hypothetical protein
MPGGEGWTREHLYSLLFSLCAALLLFINTWSTRRQLRLIRALDSSEGERPECAVDPERNTELEPFTQFKEDTFQFDDRIRAVGRVGEDGKRVFYDLDCLADL